MPGTVTQYARPQILASRVLLPQHVAELGASAIDPQSAAFGGVSAIDHAGAYDFGIRSSGRLDGICYRYWDVVGCCFNKRFVRVKPDVTVASRKYLQPVGECPRLYFIAGTTSAELADTSVPVFIVEGEKKALSLHRALASLGIPGLVVGVGGVWSWRRSQKELKPDGHMDKGPSRPIEDLDLVGWAGRVVNILFDSDVETNRLIGAAELALARELSSRGAQVALGRVPQLASAKTGLDDLIVARGAVAVNHVIADAFPFDGHARPRYVHLNEIENAALGRKRLAMDFMVSAVGDCYLLPRTIRLRCQPDDEQQGGSGLHLVGEQDDTADEAVVKPGGCPHMSRDNGFWTTEVTNPEILIDLTKVSAAAVIKRLDAYAFALCGSATVVEIQTRQAVTSFLASPRTRRLRKASCEQGSEVQDERGRPYRERMVYLLGRLDTASRYFRGIGLAIANPKTQEATAFFWKLTPLAEDYENFILTDDIREQFEVFAAEPEHASQKLDELATTLTDELTQIYGAHRRRSLLGKLLVFHSIRAFHFDGELLRRGWLEMLEIGDTGQGKTQQVDRLMDATGLGEAVDGVSTTRTGLAYAFMKFNETWFLVWGKYPLNDGRLLFIDEAQNLAPDDIDKIRKGRSNGVIEAVGIRSGEHPTRTRLIFSCNPRREGVVDDEMFGIDLVRQTFKDEDIRRFDFAIISASSDDKADINQPRPHQDGARRIPDDLLASSIRWAWSRRHDQVVFTPEATRAVYQASQDLAARYGHARDIPLALESDVRHKVARLAVSAAALLHSTDKTHQQVIVLPEHVIAVVMFLMDIYEHPNCSFGLYAGFRKAEADLSEEEYVRLWKHFRAFHVEKDTTLTQEDLVALLRTFVGHSGVVGREDLAGELGKTREWTSKIVRVLKAEKLIRVNKGRAGGYRATPRFSKFLKLAIGKKDLQA